MVENRRRLAAALGFPPEQVAIGRQVHGAEMAMHTRSAGAKPVRRAGQRDSRGRRPRRRRAGPALLVFVADCVPVALSGPGGVAMLHCGWRGLAAGIIARGVDGHWGHSCGDWPFDRALLLRGGPEVLDAFG